VARDLLIHISATEPYSIFNQVHSFACSVRSRGNAADIERIDALASAMRARHPFLCTRLLTTYREISRIMVPNALETLVVRLEQLLLRASDVNLSSVAANTGATSGPAFQEAAKQIVSELQAAGGEVSSVIVPQFQRVFDPVIGKLCSVLSSASYPSQCEDLKEADLALMNACIQWISEMRTTSTVPGANIRINGLECTAVTKKPVFLCSVSPLLASQSTVRKLEIPGQYYVQGEPSPKRHIQISYMHPEIFLLPAAASYQRCIGFVGNNGKAYFFRVTTSLHCPEDSWTQHDASRDQLVRAVSTALRNEVRARSRGIFLRPPTSVPISDSVQIVNLPLFLFSFWQIYEVWSRYFPLLINH